jgi:hypothetical protein
MDGTVVVGIGTTDQDAAVLTWAADQAGRSRDALYVVHAYRVLVSADRYWSPLVRANDARRGIAQHVTASAVQIARGTHADLPVDGSSIAGPAIAVLADVSHVADLLVVGRRARTPPSDVRALSADSVSPLVFVGEQPRTEGPVVLILDGDAPTEGFPTVADFAFVAAEERGVGLLIVQAGTPEKPESMACAAALAVQTDRQEQLDIALAPWQERFPTVGVTVEVRGETFDRVLLHVVDAGQLLVLAGGSADVWAALDGLPNQAAIAVVPTTTQRGSPCSTSRPDNPAASSPSRPVTRTSSAASGSRRQKVGTAQT